jgi:hypothetical protein
VGHACDRVEYKGAACGHEGCIHLKVPIHVDGTGQPLAGDWDDLTCPHWTNCCYTIFRLRTQLRRRRTSERFEGTRSSAARTAANEGYSHL